MGDLDAKLGAWLDNAEVQEALHVKSGSKWLDADETGPVATNLLDDFTKSVVPQVE